MSRRIKKKISNALICGGAIELHKHYPDSRRLAFMKEAQNNHPHRKIKMETLSQALFESAAEGLVIVDRAGLIQLANPRLEELFGYTADELEGMSVDMLVPDRFRNRHVGHRESYTAKPGRRSMGIGMDLSGRRKDGSEFPVEISMNHFEADGETLVMALITDITTRKEAEGKLEILYSELETRVHARTQELRESQRLHNLIARNFPNGTINVFDRALNYRFVEGRELYRVGVTGDQLVGTNYLDRLPAEVRSTMRARLMPVFEGSPATFELTVQDNIYELNAVPLPDEKGMVPQILVVEQNVTQQKKAEEDILSALSKERQLNELKSRFVSMASHEFRTPLSTILSSVTLVSRYTELQQKEKRDKHIQRIRGAVKNLTGILNDFLSLDKLETGNVSSHPETLHLPELLQDLQEEMQEIAAKGQTVHLDFKGKESVTLDGKMLRNILINLISNAIKYSPEGGQIDIEARSENGNLRFSVRDQGIGIPEADQKHMFERFFRASNAINIQGTGLGLNIVKRYLDLMGGSIFFESRPGAGTTFFVEIPMH